MPRHYDLIAFDWDGTLFDSTAIIARSIQAAVRDVGGTEPTLEQASYVIGMGLKQALAHAAPDVPESMHAALGDRYRHHYFAAQDDIVMFAGVFELLADLKERGFHLAVATGKSRRGLDAALASQALVGVFDGSRTADETAGKPDPRMLFELMDQFQVAPERTLMIGDTTHDLLMAARAGCAGVAVSYGAHDGAAFADLMPKFVAHSVPELHQWMQHNA